MKKFAFLFLVAGSLYAQNRNSIDSLNGIPFDQKIANAAVLDVAFLKNAADAHKIGYKKGEAISYSNLSLIYYYQGKYSLQVNYSLKAIAMFEQLNDLQRLAYEYGGFGYSIKRRNMPQALYYMRKGKKLAESQKDTVSLLSIYNNYGVLKEMSNEPDSALYFYKKGLRYKEAVRDSIGIPYSINNIAGIYAIKKKYAAAEKLYDQALSMRIRLKDDVGIAENYSYFGDLNLLIGNYRKALGYYRKTLEMAKDHNYIDMISNSYKVISEIHEKLGNSNEALANFKLYEQFKDSLVNRSTNEKIAELEVRFDTNNKEKLLAENKNLLLRREAEARRKNFMMLMLMVLSAFIGLAGFLFYRQQRLKNHQQIQEHELKTAIAQIETQNKLHAQRLSISRDLHDNIGAQLTFIISSVDNIKYAFDLKDTKLDRKLQSISSFTKDTILELRDTIWAMNTTDITVEDLMTRILNFIEKAKNAKETTEFTVDIADDLRRIKLSSVAGMNVYRTIQEAVNNAIKYSHAPTIKIGVQRVGNEIAIDIKDNGRGFDIAAAEGNGLKNMKKRISEIGGTFCLTSQPGSGTEITFSVHLPNQNTTDAVL